MRRKIKLEFVLSNFNLLSCEFYGLGLGARFTYWQIVTYLPIRHVAQMPESYVSES